MNMRAIKEEDYPVWEKFCDGVEAILPLLERICEETGKGKGYEIGLLARRALTAVENERDPNWRGTYDVRVMFVRDGIVFAHNGEDWEDDMIDTVNGWEAVWEVVHEYAARIYGDEMPTAITREALIENASNTRCNLYRNKSGIVTVNFRYLAEGVPCVITTSIRRSLY